MTYILIKKEDIEKEKMLYQKIINEAGKAAFEGDDSEKNRDKFIKFTGKYYGLDKIYELGKKISLDEKDIDNKVLYQFEDGPEEYDNKEYSIWLSGINKGYKKALKDLL